MEAIYKASSQTIAEAKKAMLHAIDTRCQFEETTSNSASTIKQLQGIAKKIERLDYRASSYIVANEIDFDSYVNSSKQNGTRANIYSIPKFLELCSILNGGDFLAMNGGDNATIASTIVALHNDFNVQKSLAFEVNDLMTGIRRFQAMRGDTAQGSVYAGILLGKLYSYANGATQGGSTLRAMEALQIVKEVTRDGNCKVWTFRNDDESTQTLILKAYKALAANMWQSEQDAGYINKTRLAYIVPESVLIDVLKTATEQATEQEAEQQEAEQQAQTQAAAQQAQRESDLALSVADSDGMGLAIVSVPAKQEAAATEQDAKENSARELVAELKGKQKATPKKAAPAKQGNLINIFDKEAMQAEVERQAEEKKQRALAKRRATLAAKKAAKN